MILWTIENFGVFKKWITITQILILMIFVWILALKQGNQDLSGDRFDKWNYVSIFSVCIIAGMAVLFFFQMCFKPKTKLSVQPVETLIGSSILDNDREFV